MQPTPEREDCYAEITATATIGAVLAGSVVLSLALASPTGFDDVWTTTISAAVLRVAEDRLAIGGNGHAGRWCMILGRRGGSVGHRTSTH